MSLPVISFVTYLTSTAGVKWRRADYNARDFALAIKDRDIREYAFARVAGRWRRFDNGNRQVVVGWFGEMVAAYAEEHPIPAPFVLAPVPGSQVHVELAGVSRTAVLAGAISEALPSQPPVCDALRWEMPIVSSRLMAGTREVEVLYERLRLCRRVLHERIVLVDDVVAMGGHLRACAAKLRSAGAEVVLGVCVGRADPIQTADPFAVRVEMLTDFDPLVRQR